MPSDRREHEKLATIPMGIGDLVLSPDGDRLAFHGAVYAAGTLLFAARSLGDGPVAPERSRATLPPTYDFDMGSSVGGDNAAPRRGQQSRALLVGRWPLALDIVEKQGRTPIVRVDAQSGTVTEITHGDQAVLDFSVSPDARQIVALISSPVMIGDLFAVGR